MDTKSNFSKKPSRPSKGRGISEYRPSDAGKGLKQGDFPRKAAGDRAKYHTGRPADTRPENRSRKESQSFPGGRRDSRAENAFLDPAEDAFPLEGDRIVGRNAVIEAFRAERTVDTVFLAEGEPGVSSAAGKIRAMARDVGAVVKTATKQKLDQLAGGVSHQGVVAFCSCAEYATVEDILAEAARKGTAPFLLIADEIEDPHNLGAILRTAEACGADGVILPKRRSACLNTTVYKTSAGAASVVKVARVPNLVACIQELKKKNVWIYGAEMEGTSWDTLDFTGPCALVIGSEGKGLSRLVREECDFLATLPMNGQINSLNASVAAGILLYEVVRQRGSTR